MDFDIKGARDAGYSDNEIADFMGKDSGFDVAGAQKAGYSPAEIVGHLSTVRKPDATPAYEAGAGRGRTNPVGDERSRRIAEMDEETDPSNPNYLPITKNAQSALRTPINSDVVDESSPAKPSAVATELASLRDSFFSGVDSSRASLKTVNVAAQASALQAKRDNLAQLEAAGKGKSPEADGVRKYIQAYEKRLPTMISGMTEAQADAKRGSDMTTRPAVAALNKAKTFSEAWDIFAQNPYDVIAGVSSQSLANTIPALITGAVLGPVAGASMMGLSSAATEAGSSLGEFAGERGVDMTNPKAVEAFFSDRNNLTEAMAYAGKRAGIIGALDAASGGLAGKTIAPALKSKIARQAINLPAQMSAQAALGAGGEAGAQLATKGKIDQPGQVLMEAAGELGGAPLEVAAFGNDARLAAREKAHAEKYPTDPGTLPGVPPAPVDPVAAIAKAQTVEQAIAAATAATQTNPGESIAAVDNIEVLLKSRATTQDTALPAAVTNPEIEQMTRRIAELENLNARQTPLPAEPIPAPDAVPAPAAATTQLPGADGAQPGALDATRPVPAAVTARVAAPSAAPQAEAAPAQAPAALGIDPAGQPAAVTPGRAGHLEAAGLTVDNNSPVTQIRPNEQPGQKTAIPGSIRDARMDRFRPDGRASASTERALDGRSDLAGTAGESEKPTSTLKPNGTLDIKGDPVAITAQLKAAGLSGIRTRDGVQVGKSQAENAQRIFEPKEPPAQSVPVQSATNSVAPAGPVQLGRDNQPLAEGGKPFKTRLAAADAKKLQPMMRVVSVKGGFALTEKTEKQLAAEAKAARRLRNPQTSAQGEPVPVHAFVAAEGGLHADTRADMNVGANPRVGNRNLFAGKGKGLSMERATARLIEEGYLSEGAGHSEAMALIKRSLTQPQYNADGIERIAEAEAMTQFDDYLAAEQESPGDPFLLDDSDLLEDIGYSQASRADQAAFNALIAAAEAEGIDTESILFDAHDETPNGTTDDFQNNAATRIEQARKLSQQAVERARSEQGRLAAEPEGAGNGREVPGAQGAEGPASQVDPAAQATAILDAAKVTGKERIDVLKDVKNGDVTPDELQAAYPAKSEGLTAPSQQDVLNQQDRTEKADRTALAKRRADDELDRRERIRKDIAKASEAAADTFTLGGDAEQNLSGQGGMFDELAPAADQTDTPAFRKWFAGSKVVDAAGKPLAMYHGTSASQGGKAFTAFDTYASSYGLMGMGGYFTADPAVASSYTSKGKGDSPTVYPAYLSIKNPLDMDAKADPAAWSKQFEDIAEYHDGGATNESWYRAAEESLSDQRIPKYEGAEIMQDGLRAMGFDGITHIGGGRVKSDGVKHRVYIAFEPEQIKSATGNKGTFDPFNPDITLARQASPATGLPVSEVKAITDKLSAKWQSGPAVQVVASPLDFPIDAPSDARGLIYRGIAYIAASNHLSSDDVARTLAHEAIGHHGLWKILGSEGAKRFSRSLQLAIKSGNVPLNKIAAKVRQLYVDDSGNFNLSAKQESDEIAAFAVEDAIDAKTGEFKPGYGFVKEVYAKLAAWLRDTMGIKVPFTMAELHGMLVASMRGLEAGVRLSGGGKSMVAAGRGANEASPDGADALSRGTAAGQTDTPAFKAWFGDSKVVDANGEPLKVYHRTTYTGPDGKGLEAFKPDTGWFTADAGEANMYGGQGGEGANIVPAYLSIRNPRILQVSELTQRADTTISEALTDSSVDGVLLMEGETLRWAVVVEPTQIKSTTGNNGAFNPVNPDIAFARGTADDLLNQAIKRQPQPHSNTKLKWRDATGRLQFAPGQALYDLIGNAAGPLLNKLGLKAASPELRRQLRQMKIDVEKAQEKTVAIAKETGKLSQEERDMVSDLIEQELKVGVIPAAHTVKLSVLINEAMGEQTDELVRLGMMTKDGGDKWRGKYLPRFYKSKLTKEVGDAWADALTRMTGRTSAMKGIRGNHLKSRGLFETIPEGQLKDYEALGWEVRDPDYSPGLPAIDGTVQVWRDFTRQERDKMGEVRDSGFRFVMGYMQTQRDIALGKMFERIALDAALSSRLAKEGFTVQVPSTIVPGTGAKRYGHLAGRFVAPETLSNLSSIEESQSEAWQMYRKAMGIWKEGKTALNPVSHVNNIVSNLTMAHLAGVSYHRADKYLAAIKDFAAKSPALLEAKEAGLFLGSMSEVELMNTLPDELKLLARQQESKGALVGRSAMNLMTFFLRKPMGAAYQAEDTFFRYLIWKDAKEHGMNSGDAVDYAQKYIFTYDDLPKGARMVRDFALPFFSYTYKAAPALLHTALTHPLRMAAPAALLWAVNAAAYAVVAGGDDDDSWTDSLRRYLQDPDFRAKAREKEKLEREFLPPWMKGATALMTPKTLRLGTDELTKLPLFIDISRIIPGGDLFDVSPNAGGLPIPQPITPSHPLFTMGVAMLANKDMFFGKEVVDSNDTTAEAAAKRGAWLWKQLTPAIAAGNYHWERGMNALAQATGSEVTWMPDVLGGDATGIGRDGNPVQAKYAVAQTFGIKIRPIDLDTSASIDRSMRNKMIHDIDGEIKKMTRLGAKGAVSDRVVDKENDKSREKKDRLRNGLTVDGDERR